MNLIFEKREMTFLIKTNYYLYRWSICCRYLDTTGISGITFVHGRLAIIVNMVNEEILIGFIMCYSENVNVPQSRKVIHRTLFTT